MKLHHQYHIHEQSQLPPIVLIHGLFGSLSNLGMLARGFMSIRSVLQIDVRNHGESAHAAEMNYATLAQDVLETLDDLDISQCAVIGHSMGGKIAMAMVAHAPERIQQAVILDMSPYAYTEGHHHEIFKALFAVVQAQPQSRVEAAKIMRDWIDEEVVIQFLLKSFHQGEWRFNLTAIYDQYHEILNWNKIEPQSHELLFIRGGDSDYVESQAQQNAVYEQFPNAVIHTVVGASHWLHAEKTAEVLALIDAYFSQKN